LAYWQEEARKKAEEARKDEARKKVRFRVPLCKGKARLCRFLHSRFRNTCNRTVKGFDAEKKRKQAKEVRHCC